MILDPQLLAKISKCIIVELLSIVRDDDPGNSEVANDASLLEASDIFLYNSGQWFYLDPFGKVVDPYDEELELLYGDEEGSNCVQSPLGERLRGAHRCEFLGWLPYDIAEVLALVTRPYLGLGILLHSGLIISSLYQLINQRACSRMVPAYPFVYFFHDIVCFIRDQVP